MKTHNAPAHNYSIITSLKPEAISARDLVKPDEAFWIGDLGTVNSTIEIWEENLPDVHLNYAVKCCNEPHLLKFLADRGIGFDCASKTEIQTMIELGVDPSNIVYSHPLKSIEAMEYAKENGVERLVYDSEEELHKIMQYYPSCEVYLRVKPKFSNAKIQLSKKFGAEEKDIQSLLQLTKDIGSNFIGFSFHVGSLCDDLATWKTAFEYIRDLKNKAEDIGLTCCFIDIGGGFLPLHSPCNASFQEISHVIQSCISELFNEDEIEFLGEPGRFIACEYMDLYMPIIGRKEHIDENGEENQSLYIPDGIYSAFNCIPYDHAEPHFEIFAEIDDEEELIPTFLWGQTCDSMDIIYEDMMWPKLSVGDILVVHRFGAYTYSPSSFFNGFLHHKVLIINDPNAKTEKKK